MLVSDNEAGGSESKTFTAMPWRRACSRSGRRPSASSRSMLMPLGLERIAASRIAACRASSERAGGRYSTTAGFFVCLLIIRAAASAPSRTVSNQGWASLGTKTKRSGLATAPAMEPVRRWPSRETARRETPRDAARIGRESMGIWPTAWPGRIAGAHRPMPPNLFNFQLAYHSGGQDQAVS